MTTTQDKPVIDTDELEELFHDECKCQSRHRRGIFCSGEVVAITDYSCNPKDKRLICKNTVNSIQNDIEEALLMCGVCLGPVEECWGWRAI